MNRQQAKENQLELCDSCLKDEALELIDLIYDGFEGRVCDSCIHIRVTQFRNYETATCTNEECNEMFDCDVGDDFGCNKWEQK